MTAIRIRLATLAVIATAMAWPAAADATWTIRGHGFGHGVGLSQWGAYGYAKHGTGYKRILRHYYTDTKIGAGHGRVRVLLGSCEGAIGFNGAGRACGRRLGDRATASPSSGGGSYCATPSGLTVCVWASAAWRSTFGRHRSASSPAASGNML
jgi:stage II sporulation protein D